MIKTKYPVPKYGVFGAANQIRTDDLILTKDVLYQLSHSSRFVSTERLIIISEHSTFVKCFFEKISNNFSKKQRKVSTERFPVRSSLF